MKKQLSLLSTIFLCLVTCAVTFVATASISYNNYKIKLNEEYSYFEQFKKLNEEYSYFGQFKKLIDIDNYVKSNFVGDYDAEAVITTMLDGYFAGLGDPFSMYHTKEEMEEMDAQTKGKIHGIGVYVVANIDTGYIYIKQVMADSPAQEAGLKAGDQICSVSGIYVTHETYSECINLIKGEDNTGVNLRIIRSDSSEEEITVVRREFKSQAVFMDYIETDGNKYAKINIIEFSGNVTQDFKNCMAEAKSQNADGYIFDIRSNPGGDLKIICSVLDSILPQGPIVYIKNSKGETISEKLSEGKTPLEKPAVVLVNGETASAGELFAAAAKDYQIAKIIGTQTFGKGTMQQIVNLDDGSGIRLSISYYDPPKSENYHGIGITPDITAELDEYYKNRSYLLDINTDNQLITAVNELNKTIEGNK